MGLELTEKQTMQAFYRHNRVLQSKNRFKISTKIKAQCLKCLKPIYVSYFENNVSALFCDDHKNHANENNLAQLHYLRIIKEEQIKTLTQH